MVKVGYKGQGFDSFRVPNDEPETVSSVKLVEVKGTPKSFTTSRCPYATGDSHTS